MMMFDGLTSGLRWIFWGIVYLSVLLTALVLVARIPLSAPLQLGVMFVFIWGIALDVQRKREPQTA
jgi:hypothetical protein